MGTLPAWIAQNAAMNTPNESSAAIPPEASPAMPSGEASDSSSERCPFQYSLRSLFILTAAVSGCLSLIMGTPDWLIGPMFSATAMIVPPLLLALLIWGKPDQRAFALGAILPSSYLMLTLLGITPWPGRLAERWFGLRLSWETRSTIWSFVWLVAALAGLMCVFVRRRMSRAEKKPARR